MLLQLIHQHGNFYFAFKFITTLLTNKILCVAVTCTSNLAFISFRFYKERATDVTQGKRLSDWCMYRDEFDWQKKKGKID